MSRFTNCFRFYRDDAGHLVFPFVRKRRNREIQILTYHRVNNDRDPYFSGVPTDVFRKQIAYLASHAYICSLEEAVERMKKADVPDNTIVVTFDDGYRDNFVNAFPILQEFSIPATFFLATAAIGSGYTLWHDKVFSAFRETQKISLSNYGPHSQNYSLRTVEERFFAQTQLLKFLKSLDGEERSFWITRLRDQLGVVDEGEMSDLMLTWDQVRTMHRSGMSFGSHTMTHPILSRLPCRADERRDIRLERNHRGKFGSFNNDFCLSEWDEGRL